MKNTFHFTLKALFALEILPVLSWLFDYVERRPDNKAIVNSKFMKAQTGQQIPTIHILPNIEVKAIRKWNLVS